MGKPIFGGIRTAAQETESHERRLAVSRSSSRRASQQPDVGCRESNTRRQCDQLGPRRQLRMLRSADPGRSNRQRANDLVQTVQPAKRRLTAARPKRKSSLEPTAELLSASTSTQQDDAESTSSAKGHTSSMSELVHIDSPSEHACEQPSIERLEVLEPVSGRWSWIRLFRCCNLAAVESNDEEQTQPVIKRAA
jgi:hypothetical protein